MSELAVRKLLVDLTTPFEQRWCGGDAFKSAFFNALSLSFPVGEQFFIDSVREGAKQMDEATREKFAAEVQGFIGQEATHRRIHALFNGHLEKQGFENKIAARNAKRIKANAHQNVRQQLAATAATEHFTDVFADWLLSHPEILMAQNLVSRPCGNGTLQKKPSTVAPPLMFTKPWAAMKNGALVFFTT